MPSRATVFCREPFESACVFFTGDVSLCSCPGLMTVPIGNVLRNSFEEVWNSPMAKKIRRAVRVGNMAYCAPNCPLVVSGLSQGKVRLADRNHDDGVPQRTMAETRGPEQVALAYDPSCNLHCTFCRQGVALPIAIGKEAVGRIHDVVVNEVLPSASCITLANFGEPFVSRYYLDILQNFDGLRWPRLRIQLITNGLCLNPVAWHSIQRSHGAIDGIQVSVNAATKATYEATHRGGRFEALLTALSFLKSLREAGAVRTVAISFVVQQSTYREARDFVALGRIFNVDCVAFSTLIQSSWAHTDEGYAQEAVHLPGHPEHEEFLKVLSDPIFHQPFVNLSCLAVPSMATPPLHQNRPLPMKYVDFCESHGLDAVQVRAVVKVLNELKDAFTRLLRLPARDATQCPAAFLAEHIGRGADADSAGLHELFMAYLIGHRERLSSRTYAELCAELEQKARCSIMAVLNEFQLQRFADGPGQELLDIDTGYDPFTESIARRVEGLAKRIKVVVDAQNGLPHV
jgi:MoaA/NifB/PqqE/SkfB family radical SAM enzyme